MKKKAPRAIHDLAVPISNTSRQLNTSYRKFYPVLEQLLWGTISGLQELSFEAEYTSFTRHHCKKHR